MLAVLALAGGTLPDSPLETGNVALFEMLHAAPDAPAWLVAGAILAAEYALPCGIALAVWACWRRCDARPMFLALAAWLVANRIEALIAALAPHARPFEVGFGPALLAHAADNSMPSSHVATALILCGALLAARRFGPAATLAAIALLLAWSRIYVGIHWPLDMLGAMASAGVSLGIVLGLRHAWRGWRTAPARQGHRAHAS